MPWTHIIDPTDASQAVCRIPGVTLNQLATEDQATCPNCKSGLQYRKLKAIRKQTNLAIDTLKLSQKDYLALKGLPFEDQQELDIINIMLELYVHSIALRGRIEDLEDAQQYMRRRE